MIDLLAVQDLPEQIQSAELIEAMIAGANAKAVRVAPCLASTTATTEQQDEARLILIGTVKRWVEAGAGSFSQQTAGPFSATVDTRQRSGYTLWPTEIRDLQAICKSSDDQTAFVIDTVSECGFHSWYCSVNFGSSDCSCGAVLAGYPIYETT